MNETSATCEVRFAAPDDDGTVEGVAVRFDVVDSFRTTFDSRSFAASVGKSVPMLWSHDPAEVVGRWTNIEIGDGLRIRGKLNLEVQRAREVRSLLVAGDIAGLSVGFQTLKDERRAGGIRHITEAILREVSFVAMPSVPGSQVTSIRNGRADERVAAFIEAIQQTTRSLQRTS